MTGAARSRLRHTRENVLELSNVAIFTTESGGYGDTTPNSRSLYLAC